MKPGLTKGVALFLAGAVLLCAGGPVLAQNAVQATSEAASSGVAGDPRTRAQ